MIPTHLVCCYLGILQQTLRLWLCINITLKRQISIRQTAELKIFTGPLGSFSLKLDQVHIFYSNQVCEVSEILDLWRSLGWPNNGPRQTNSYIIKPRLVFGQIRIRKKLIGWCFGAPWAATGSLLCQFESRSMSAERKQNCWTTNKQTNSIYSPVLIQLPAPSGSSQGQR